MHISTRNTAAVLKHLIKAAKKIAELEGRRPELAAPRGALRVNSRKGCGARFRCSTLKIEMVVVDAVGPGLAVAVPKKLVANAPNIPAQILHGTMGSQTKFTPVGTANANIDSGRQVATTSNSRRRKSCN